jgi:hypothetical protein
MVGVVEMRALREQVSRCAAAFDPALVDGYDADRILRDAAAAKNMLAGIEAAAAKRVADTQAFRRDGHRNAAQHLAEASGTSVSQAREQIETAARVETLAKVHQAVKNGDLSPQKAAAVADAAAADPSKEEHLLNVALTRSLGETREECAKVKAAAQPDQDELRRQARANRRCCPRSSADQVGRIFYQSSTDQMHEIWTAVKTKADTVFDQARAQGRREPWEAYAADALLAIIREWSAGSTVDAPNKSSSSATKVIVRVDWDALTRGRVHDGELCEIAGVGPVPVTWVRDLLATGDPFVTAILTKGVDVCTVAHLGRKPTAFQKTALQWLMPTCTVAGCNNTENIEYDHRDDWAKTHRTPTDGLDGLCPPDHDLKTHHGWSLVEGTGKRAFVPPGHPDHPNNKHGPPP